MVTRHIKPWKRSNNNLSTESDVHSLRGLQRDVDSIFEDFFRGFNLSPIISQHEPELLTPKIDIAESTKSFHLSLEIPGVDEKDIDVSVADNILIVKGEKKSEEKQDDKNYHRVEHSYGMFQRAITLPDNVDQNSIEASFKNGILEVEVPKTKETKSQVKQIKVKS